ncbi:MAG: Crp/Fnr family transcriptional regulator [Chitinophagaceae bacterium]|jgi:CRP-like cAMP-binding protein|nr:Crp/Fnr family transcriptional regulator [Chitinophagaceae bacterium]OQY93244.1 MAG: hypothetical protein B6D37_12335 [Sphingobacteriales bacterium UTBCD1]
MNILLTSPASLSSGNHKKEISSLVITLNQFHSLSDPAVKYLKEILFPVSFKKGELLLKAGDLCNHVYFIKKGVIRGFIKEGIKDITTWITAENEMVTSISCLDHRELNEENMQAVEDCDAYAISYSGLENLYLKFPEFNIVVRKILQRYYKDAEDRAFIVRLTNAETKYLYFLKRYSHLTNRVPLKYIASFLGITLETLSRVRKKISVQPKIK